MSTESQFEWAMREILRAVTYSLMFAWGLWMLDANIWRIAGITTIVSLMILSGIAWRRLQQVSLLFFGVGLIVWAHIPIVDHALELFRQWHP